MRRLDGYEYRPLRLPAHVSRSAAREVLQLHAHVHGWELARVHRTPDGTRQVVLRRRTRTAGDVGAGREVGP